jgi:uncharacterized protein YbjT (DUF2867 family)
MKVFVTGGTGFVGREVVRQLLAEGHTVRILARLSNADGLPAGVEVKRGDVTDPASFADGMTGVDAVIHLVGIISECGAGTYENVHTVGTAGILANSMSAGVRRFIQMSALGTRPGATSRYHRSKWAAEELVRKSGLDWTIFRPSVIYGPEDHFVNLFARISRWSPALPVIGDGKTKLQPGPVGDVARCFVASLSEPRSIGQTYDLCGADRLTLPEVLDAILEVAGRLRIKLRIPMPIAKLQAAALETIYPLVLRRAPPLNRDQLIMLGEDNVGDPQPANALFGLKPVSFREGIAAYLRPRSRTP